MLGQTLSPSQRRDEESGFTLIELLVVIAILGILAAVVVFSVRGVSDKGQQAATTTDASIVRTAEEAYRAQHGVYGDQSALVSAGLLTAQSTDTSVAVTGGGTGYLLGYGQPNNGSPASLSQIKLAAATGNGYPTPFAWVRGPGYANANYMFDPLVWKDATGNPVPWLATSWVESPDGLTWTFTLRSGVKWSDGQPLTPDDVAFTFNYQCQGPPAAMESSADTCGITQGASHGNHDGAGNSASNQGFYRSYLPYINSVVANDGANTVTFNLNTAFNTFMTNIGQSFIIIPAHIWSTVSNPFSISPVPPANQYIGTGPYTLANPTSYNPATGVAEYDANPNFFLGTPYVKKLLFVTSTNTTSDLLTGNIDAAAPGSNEFVTTADLAPLAGLPSIKNFGGWNRSIEFNFWAGFPYNNVSFRQALAYAINRPDLITRMLSGNAQVPSLGTLSPSSSFLAPNLPTYSFNTAAADSLLDSIGMTAPASCGGVAGPTCFRTLPGGAPFTAPIRTTSKFDTANLDPLLTSYLAAIGVNVSYTIDANDNNATAGNYSMMIEGWGDITSDPDNLRTRMSDAYTDVLTPSCTPAAPLHTGCYAQGGFTEVYGWNSTNDNAGYPSLADHSADFVAKGQDELTTTNASQRLSDIQAMQLDAAEDVPEIQLYVPTALLYYQTNTLSAWYNTPGGTPPGPPSFFNKEVFVLGKQFCDVTKPQC